MSDQSASGTERKCPDCGRTKATGKSGEEGLETGNIREYYFCNPVVGCGNEWSVETETVQGGDSNA